jgi:TRIAD3 protein (E3 ubiquitin-protein ligase RNF216)
VRLLLRFISLRKTPVSTSFVDVDVFAQAEMAQCSDAHLFCESCVRSYADAQLGQQSADLVCMDGSGCKAPFSETELRRVLNPKAMTLYDRLTARSNLEKAKIDGLEECPFCEYQCVIENEHEKLFRCRWEECMKVSCRACKKLVNESTLL